MPAGVTCGIQSVLNYCLPASPPITNDLKGNCVEYTILNAAFIASIRRKARVVVAYDCLGNGHAYPEVYLGDSIEDLWAVGDYLATRYNANVIYDPLRTDGKTEYWLSLDWTAQQPSGQLFADNGTYYATYLSGTGLHYWDNGPSFMRSREIAGIRVNWESFCPFFSRKGRYCQLCRMFLNLNPGKRRNI